MVSFLRQGSGIQSVEPLSGVGRMPGLGLSVAGGGAAAWPSALRDSLVAFWKLDEASGTRADSVGSNTLTDNNTVGSDTGLVYGTAADFVAANSEYLSIADNADVSTGDIDFWLAAWFRLTTDANAHIIGQWSSTAGDRSYLLFHNNGAVQFYTQGSSSTNTNSTVSISVGTWYLAIGWHDAANNEIGISVNNETPVTEAHSTGANDGAINFVIGAEASGGGPLNGRAGPAMLGKNYIPTADDRSFLYNGGSGRRL